MGIDKDKARNILLVVLILLSFLLSFHLWTAGGEIREEENELETATTKLSIANHNVEDSFRPKIVALHGMSSEEQILISNTYPLKDFLSKKNKKMNLLKLNYNGTMNLDEYVDNLNQGKWLEFVFFEEKPFGLLESKFAEMPRDVANIFFNRLFINTEEQNVLYFYHTETKEVYTTPVIEGETIDLSPFLNQENLQYVGAEKILLENDILYLSKEEVRVPKRSYVLDSLPTSTYIRYFFPDTSLVDRRSAKTYTRYIDLSKEITINNNNETLVYYKQGPLDEELDSTTRYRKSFEQIERFENWGNTFILFDYNQQNEILTFRREIDGLPVFSLGNHESTMEIGLTKDDLTHLKLPLRFTSTPITINEPSEKLISGMELFKQAQENFHPEELKKVENIIIGYTWENDDEENEVACFTPEWYVLYDGNWMTFHNFMRISEEEANGF